MAKQFSEDFQSLFLADFDKFSPPQAAGVEPAVHAVALGVGRSIYKLKLLSVSSRENLVEAASRLTAPCQIIVGPSMAWIISGMPLKLQ